MEIKKKIFKKFKKFLIFSFFFAMVSNKILSHFLETQQFTVDTIYKNQNINLHLASVANFGI